MTGHALLCLIKPIIYDQIDSSFIFCFCGTNLEIDVNYDLTSDFFYIYKRTIVDTQLGHFEWSAGEGGRRHFLEKEENSKNTFLGLLEVYSHFC